MPAVSKPCSVFNAYNFKQDIQDRIGHITKIQIGTTALTADQTVKNPIDGSDVKAVVVLSDWYWDGGKAEPFNMTGQVSAANKQNVGQLVHTGMSNTEVLFQFSLYEYDPVAKKYFKCVHCNDTDLKGLIMKRGEDLVIQISDTSSREVPEPENYAFMIGVMPQRTEQDLHLGFSDTAKVVKKWGVTVSG